MGQEGERERGRAAGYLSGEHGDRNQEDEDRGGHEAQEGGKPPAGRIAEQVVDAGGVDPGRATVRWGVGKAEHRAGEGGPICGQVVDRALVGAQLGQRLLTFDEVAEPG